MYTSVRNTKEVRCQKETPMESHRRKRHRSESSWKSAIFRDLCCSVCKRSLSLFHLPREPRRGLSSRTSLMPYRCTGGRGSRKVTPKKVYLIGQYSDGFTGADLTTADPGPDLARLEDASWRNKVSQQVQEFHPSTTPAQTGSYSSWQSKQGAYSS